jgi:hypothetical protein
MTIGILSTEFYLIDNWPGEVTDGPNPSSWTTASATEDYPLGTKRMIYDDTNSGWAILMYLKYKDGSVPEPGLAAGKFPICGMHTAAAASGDYFVVNNDASEVALTGPIAICLASNLSANTYPYAWFWVGGVCPEDTIGALNDMAYVTDGGVTAQSCMVMASSASYCAFHLATATDVCNHSAFSLVTDTTA